MRARANSSPTAPASTIWPAYMTMARSAISATRLRLCVMNRIAMPVCCCSRFRWSTICAWMVTSSAVVGSSAISSEGWLAGGIPILNGGERLDGALVRGARRDPLMHPHRLDHLRADREHRVQRRHRLLEDHGDVV